LLGERQFVTNSEQDSLPSFLVWDEMISPTLNPQRLNENLFGDTEDGRDQLLEELQACAQKVNPSSKVFY